MPTRAPERVGVQRSRRRRAPRQATHRAPRACIETDVSGSHCARPAAGMSPLAPGGAAAADDLRYLQGLMDARIVEFAEVLRQNGVRVSYVRAARRQPGGDTVHSRPGGLSRRPADHDGQALGGPGPFNRAFDVFFSARSRCWRAWSSLSSTARRHGRTRGRRARHDGGHAQPLLGEMSPLTQAVLRGDRARLTQLFRGATLQLDFSRLQSPLQAGFYARRLLAGAGGDGRAPTSAPSRQSSAAGGSRPKASSG